MSVEPIHFERLAVMIDLGVILVDPIVCLILSWLYVSLDKCVSLSILSTVRDSPRKPRSGVFCLIKIIPSTLPGHFPSMALVAASAGV